MQWIYQRDVDDFDEMTDLSKSLRAQLKNDAEISPAGSSGSGTTPKTVA